MKKLNWLSMPVKQVELAKKWGCSEAYVSKLKRRGMPLSSVEEAEAWRAANASEGSGHKSAGLPPDAVAAAAAQHLAQHAATPPAQAAASDEDPQSTVQRAQQAERQIYDLLADTTRRAVSGDQVAAAALPGLIRTHGNAYANRLDAESRYEKHRVAVGDVAPVVELEAVLDAVLEPLAAQLRNFPRNVSAAANPTAPTVAERAITAALDPILRQIALSLETHGATAPPPAADSPSTLPPS